MERYIKSDNPELRSGITLFVLILWGLNMILTEDFMEAMATDSSDVSFWGTKAAGFALIAAAALFVELIPTRSWLAENSTRAVAGIAAISSGYCWLEETTGNAGWYIAVVVVVGIVMASSVLVGAYLARISNGRSGN